MSRLNVNQIYTRTGTGSPAIREMPLFSVSLGSDQTGVAGNTDTKVLFDTVDYDFGSYWDTTNKRYLPTIPGFYQFNVVLRCQVGGGSSNLMRVRLDKNGTEQAASYVQSSTNIFINSHVTLSYLIYCNGSDYVEALGYIGTGTSTSRSFGAFVVTVGGSSFNGFLVRPD
jgi:hypothetical protein